MPCRFSEWLKPLGLYSEACDQDDLINAVAKVYSDLLVFSREACQTFQNNDGPPAKWTTVRTFFRLQWELDLPKWSRA